MSKKKFPVSVIFVILGIAAFVGLIAIAYNNKMEERRKEDEETAANNSKIEKLDLQKIIEPSEDNGMMGDNYYGPKDAQVTLVEYADYQCEFCAHFFPYVSDVIDEYGGKVNLIYRGMVLSYHKNGRSAASAANAAARQGFWHDYAMVLMAQQEKWKAESGDSLTKLYESYFTAVAGKDGDLEKFRADMKSDEVGKKIDFDGAIAKYVKIKATPTIFVGKDEFSFDSTDETEFKNSLRAKIDAALAAAEK